MTTDDEFKLIDTGDDHIVIDGQEEQVRRGGSVGQLRCITVYHGKSYMHHGTYPSSSFPSPNIHYLKDKQSV